MAKDPAFLFYDGDAARDVSHMNRLERGAYFDIIQAQKKFGKLSYENIQKILGKDFEACFNALLLILKREAEFFFIEWLDESINKRKNYSLSRKKNREGSKNDHMSIICQSYDSHMENENVNSNSSSLGSAETLSSWMQKHALFLTTGPDEWQNFEYPSGKAWSDIKKSTPIIKAEDIIAGAAKYKEYCASTGKRGQYVQAPQNWLERGGWLVDWKKIAMDNNRTITKTSLNPEPMIYGTLVTLEDLYPKKAAAVNENHN